MNGENVVKYLVAAYPHVYKTLSRIFPITLFIKQ